AARLLVVRRAGGPCEHRVFRDLGTFLEPGDLLVLNRTRVLPARLVGRRSDGAGGRAELLLLRRDTDGLWEARGRPARRLRPGAPRGLGDGRVPARVGERTPVGTARVRFAPELTQPLLDAVGAVPLPPYIRGWRGDPTRYQTVYADTPGSAAAPTAGLHFTPVLLRALQERGVGVAYLILHVGLDTFRPIHTDDAPPPTIHPDYYALPPHL